MEFEWDEAKRRSNLQKHRLDFEHTRTIDWNAGIVVELQNVDGEEREVWIGPLHIRVVVVVYVDRYGRRRIVSMWPAKSADLKRWAEELS